MKLLQVWRSFNSLFLLLSYYHRFLFSPYHGCWMCFWGVSELYVGVIVTFHAEGNLLQPEATTCGSPFFPTTYRIVNSIELLIFVFFFILLNIWNTFYARDFNERLWFYRLYQTLCESNECNTTNWKTFAECLTTIECMRNGAYHFHVYQYFGDDDNSTIWCTILKFIRNAQLNFWKHWIYIEHFADFKTVSNSCLDFTLNEELQLTILFLNSNTKKGRNRTMAWLLRNKIFNFSKGNSLCFWCRFSLVVREKLAYNNTGHSNMVYNICFHLKICRTIRYTSVNVI